MTQLILGLLAATVAGGLLGLLFLFSLWRSLQRLSTRQHPGLWMVGGMALRIGVTVGMLFLIMQLGDWRHAVAAVAGFTLVRWLTARRVSHENIEPFGGSS
jgi:F1F0 ATPase subunit 2